MNRTQKGLVTPRHDGNPGEPFSQQAGRRDFLEFAVAGAAGSIVLATGSVSASERDQSSEIEAIFPRVLRPRPPDTRRASSPAAIGSYLSRARGRPT
jgi:hypothetical protein